MIAVLLTAAAACVTAINFTLHAISEPVAYPANADTATDTLPPGRPISIIWEGDLTPGSQYGNPPGTGTSILAATRGRLQDADIAAINLEGTFGTFGTPKCASGTPTCFAFQAPPKNAAALRHAGIDIVNLANNHAWDYGAAGMKQTTDSLTARNIKFTGRPGEITYVHRPGSDVAFLGFSSYNWTSQITDLPRVRQLVSEAAHHANIVVVFMHAGAEGAKHTHTPNTDEYAYGENRGNPVAFAHAAIDAGADLVLGSGPHVLRGMEIYRRRLIAYSLGNAGGWKNFSVNDVTKISAALRVRVGRTGQLLRGKLTSLQLVGPGVQQIDADHAAVQMITDLSRADFGARAPRITKHGIVRPRTPTR